MECETNSWLKSKGYLHITAQIDVNSRYKEIYEKVTDPQYVAKYAFYPLIHSTIDERRYKRIDPSKKERAHSFTTTDGEHKRNLKSRPLHYATHLDAIIFGYYAEILQNQYEKKIKEHENLHDCIIAYRKIPVEEIEANKSTIHFAKEVFDEIKRRATVNGQCKVLTFDLKGFFPSLDHKILKQAWADLFNFKMLPDDHYSVFKAATKFSYILLDDLRVRNKSGRFGYNERKLAEIRNKQGFQAFFESPQEFRNEIKNGNLKIHKYPRRNKLKEPTGIPQGLPISAILANLYLLAFDIKVLENVVKNMQGFYRRYSDDIVIVCEPENAEKIKDFIQNNIEQSKVEISKDKTEVFLFKKLQFGNQEARLTAIKLLAGGTETFSPLTYLGFEFNGKNALIKSANLAKFYRRMISAVKRKAKRAKKIASTLPGCNPIIFRRQLYKLYTTTPVNKTQIHTRWKKFVKDKFGNYKLLTGKKTRFLRSNYLTYVSRASETMNEPAIKHQIRNHKKIFNSAINKHLNSGRMDSV